MTDKTDRELLELAAKAVGIRLEWDGRPDQWQPMYYVGKTYYVWNPLTDDGDALRLLVSLYGKVVNLHAGPGGICLNIGPAFADEFAPTSGPYDHSAATRRAIVRAAAAIGETL